MGVLKTRDITKIYPGTVALDHMTVDFESGKVHAFIGKNGSGKSTLVKIFSGAIQPTEGEVYLDDQKIVLSGPQDALSKGIATVYQELSLVPGLTVAENILIGRLPMRGSLINWPKTYAMAEKILKDLNVDISPKELVAHLSMWQCQMIEIVKAMSFNPKVLLLDEPTSSLAQHETQILFDMIRELKKRDVIIIYISHRLQELWEIADTCTVLRDGHFIGKTVMRDTTHKQLVNMMFGDVEIKTRPEDLTVGSEILMEARGLSRKGVFSNISFKVHKNEVLGIAGMLGSGRTELLRTMFGADKMDSGEIIFGDKHVTKPTVKEMKKLGFGMTSEDRKSEGLVQIMSVHDNLCVASLDDIAKGPFIKKATEKAFVERQVDHLQIKVPNIHQPVSLLSGGNQQKVVVGNWLNTSPKMMFFDEPSRGIDVNAKQQIFQIIWDQSRRGISSVIVSSELEELIEVCHRILIMKQGEIIGEVRPEEVTVEELYALCMGGN